jgi:hypothetical protein
MEHTMDSLFSKLSPLSRPRSRRPSARLFVVASVVGLGLAFVLAGCVRTAPPDDADNPSSSTDAWLAQLTDADPEVRLHARLALVREGQPAVPVLVEALQGDDRNARYEAACALSSMGRVRREEAVPALIRAAQDRDRPLQRMALEALYRIGPAAKGAGPVLRKMLRDETAPLSLTASCLARTQEAGAVPDLIEALKKPRSRLFAVYALGEVGPPARAAIPALKELAQSKEKGLQQAATEALERIQKDR